MENKKESIEKRVLHVEIDKILLSKVKAKAALLNISLSEYVEEIFFKAADDIKLDIDKLKGGSENE